MTGASLAATPTRRISRRRRRTASPMPPISAPLPTGTTIATGGVSHCSRISSAMAP